MDILTFLNLDIRFERADRGFRTVVVNSPAGEGAEATFSVPIEDMELENFALRMQQRSVLTRRIDSSRSAIARALGQRLFNSLFHDDLLVALRESVDYANSHNIGLRVRLRLSNA